MIARIDLSMYDLINKGKFLFVVCVQFYLFQVQGLLLDVNRDVSGYFLAYSW